MNRTAAVVATLSAALALLLGTDGTSLLAQGAAPAAGEPSPAPAPAAATAAQGFSKDQLEQLVAPIALYSDALLMQILMGATYPLEIVQADRFIKANPGLEGAALDEALKEQDWDPSVKSLCTLPDVLDNMSKNLDWTQDLGDAFLGQKTELLDTVQVMRGKAHEAGNLETTEQQVVTVTEEKIIVIESPSPEVVYVPSYSPTVVYAGWAPPAYYYPPMYPYYPPGAGLISFGVGMAVGGAIWGDCNWGWGHSDVDIDVNRYNNFNRNTNVNPQNLSGNRANWSHDPSHRKGVSYQNGNVAGQYGAKSGSSRVSRDQAQAQARGYSSERSGTRQAHTPDAAATRSMQDRAASGQGAAARDRQPGEAAGAARDRQAGGQTGAAAKDRASAASSSAGPARSERSGSATTRSSGSGSGRSAYSGSSRPSYDRAASSRGAASRGTTSFGGSRGGGRRR